MSCRFQPSHMDSRATDELSALLLRKMEASMEAELRGTLGRLGHLPLLSVGQGPGHSLSERGFSARNA